MQYKKRYKIIGVVILVLLVLIHLCLRIGWWLVGLPVDQREQWYGFNWIPFAGFIDFLKQQGAFKIVGKVVYYAVYGILFSLLLQNRPHLVRNFALVSLFTIVLEEALFLLLDRDTIVVFDMNNIVLYLCGLVIGFAMYQLFMCCRKKIKT